MRDQAAWICMPMTLPPDESHHFFKTGYHPENNKFLLAICNVAHYMSKSVSRAGPQPVVHREALRDSCMWLRPLARIKIKPGDRTHLKNEKQQPDISADKRPCNPGEILKKKYLDPMGMTQQELADRLGITRVRINEVLLGKRAITPDTAIRLARFFDTTVKFWLGMQNDLDLWEAKKNNEEEYRKITPLKEIKKG